MTMQQVTMSEYLQTRYGSFPHCGSCVCQKCLYWWSGRCPEGECYDDKRAKEEPYNKAFPERSPRTQWSNWNLPGEQAHWCRGGTFYPVSYCEHFVKYQGAEIEDCIRAPVQYFQDGYLKCTLKDRIGCEACTMGRNDKNIFDCQYMTDSGCNKLIEAKNRMLDAIASGAEIEPCERQCCAGCTRQCQYRCGVK